MCKEPRKERVRVDYLLQLQMSMYVLEMFLHVCVWQEGKKEINLVDYLIQIHISVGMLEIQTLVLM